MKTVKTMKIVKNVKSEKTVKNVKSEKLRTEKKDYVKTA